MADRGLTQDVRLFLGGRDLEMETIAALGRRALGAARVHDRRLSWGAKASAYAEEIEESLRADERPVLVELADDLPEGVDRSRLYFVDHHGARAGRDRPSSLRQVFDLLNRPQVEWTRRERLVEANDIGHIAALRDLGASVDEIRAIRDADRRAQGVTANDEDDARRGLAESDVRGLLRIVRLRGERTSPVGDFVEPEYGGTGADNLVVLTPEAAHFFGEGKVVLALAECWGSQESWFGGALPARGFWGARICGSDHPGLIRAIRAVLEPGEQES